MKAYLTNPTRRRLRPRGLALVVVVALVGLLTLLTVTLLTLVTFSRQTNDLEAESRKSEVLARSAFNTVLADLTDEMNKGAASVTESRLDDGTTLRRYDFTGKPAGMTVAKALKSDDFKETTLVKQSAFKVPFHVYGDEAPQRSSEESTASGKDPLDPTIWAKPRLLQDSIKLSKQTSPDWIYVTRDGRNPVAFTGELKQRETSGATNPMFVVGRYAYNLYDTSGLLDINVAGHPKDKPGAERAGQKGTLAMADLAGIPGMTATGVENLAAWKHDWSSIPAVTTSAKFPPTSPENDYIRLSEGSGWQVLADNDNLFLGRQDLLRFAKLRPDDLPLAVLPFFTHFSRDLDAPSWRPHPNRPKIARSADKGGNDAFGQDDVLNPDPVAFDKKRQRQLLPRRFPLERLKWVATPGAKGPLDAEKAERYFGLRWKGGYWEYVHGRSDGRMYTLQDVPTSREPNFFEILRATVLAGSLGRQFAAEGHDGLDQALSMHQLPGPNGSGVDGSINLNIMELGACIIDEADADSNPTAIVITGGLRPYFAFGKEDVPYINRMSAIPYRGNPVPGAVVYKDDGTPASSECYEGSMVLQPMLWRPHQVVKNYDGPTTFRIRPQHIDVTGGGSKFWMIGGWRVPGKGDPPSLNQTSWKIAGDYTYWGGPNFSITHPQLFPKTFKGDEYIDVTLPAGSTAFREPQSVHSPDHGTVAGYSLGGNVDPIPVRSGDLRWEGLPNSYSKVSGFLVGYALTARIEAGASSGNRLGVGYFRGDPIEVIMEYQAPDGKWRQYQRAEFTYKSNWGDHYLRPDPQWQTEAFHWSSYLIDPRTARFGGLATVLAGGLNITNWTSLHPQMTWPEGCALDFGKNRSEGVRPGWTIPRRNTGWNFTLGPNWYDPYNPGAVAENNEAAWGDQMSFCYKDPDDVLRPGVAALNDYSGGIFAGNPMSRRCTLSSTGKLTVPASLAGRPRILNREFRSVAELAYSFRGTPWRDIDFLNPSSPDSGLLDVFSLYEDPDEKKVDETKPPVVAGRVNLNSASKEVIAALLRGTAIDEGVYLNDSKVISNMTDEVYRWVRSTTDGEGPLASKAALIGSSIPNIKAKGLIFNLSGKLTDKQDRAINDRRECAVRALSDGTTVRSWNFMLDLVVQSGQLSGAATSLQQFQPAAERRFWIHFAIDRPTGRLLEVQWEPVTD